MFSACKAVRVKDSVGGALENRLLLGFGVYGVRA